MLDRDHKSALIIGPLLLIGFIVFFTGAKSCTMNEFDSKHNIEMEEIKLEKIKWESRCCEEE